MTPCASQTCRALKRQIIASTDSVWITDALLASAFERYCLVSRAASRKASNVPGPLESQRRLGRRPLAGASTWVSPPTPPAWAFPVPLNLAKWTWEPPSSAHAPQQGRLPRGDNSAGGLARLLPIWLRESTPRDARELPPPSTVALVDTDSQPVPVTRTMASLAPDMDAFRWAATHASIDTLASQTRAICDKLQQLIFLGEIPTEDVVSLSAAIWEALQSRLPGSQMARRLHLSVCTAILAGSTSSRVFSPSLLGARFWDTLFTHMSTLPADDELCNLLPDVMRALPEAHLPRLMDALLAVLGRFFSAWSCSGDGGPHPDEITRMLDSSQFGREQREPNPAPLAANLRQARGIAKALRAISPSPQRRLLEVANRLVVDQAAFSTTGRLWLRYTWLYVLAQLPLVEEDFLFGAAAALSEPPLEMAALAPVELSSLLLTQWTSREYIKFPRNLYRTYRKYLDQRGTAALSALFLALFRCQRIEKMRACYCSAWKLVTLLDQADDVFESLRCHVQENQTTALPVRMLENLASASNNHYIAIRLRDLWARRLKPPSGPQFNPRVFEKFAESIVLDPRLPSETIWRVLDINHFKGRQKSFESKVRCHRGAYGRFRVEIAARVSTVFANAPHLSSRAAFRHVEQTYTFIWAVQGRVPFSVFRDIYRVVTRDLWRGKPGVTKRLLWFLSKLQKQYSLELAWACRLALRRWRARLRSGWTKH